MSAESVLMRKSGWMNGPLTSCAFHSRAQIQAVVAFLALLLGCEQHSTLEMEPRAATKDQEPDPFWHLDDVMPSRLLVRWTNTNRPDVSRSELVAETLRTLSNDTNEIVDFHDVPLDEELRATLGRLTRVKWLSVSANVRGSDLRWICQMKQLHGLSLARADLRSCELSHLSDLGSIIWLNLQWADMSVDEFKTFPSLQTLQTLILDGTSVTDEHMFHLASIDLPSLSRLVLRYTSITDRGINALFSAYDLETLCLDRCQGVTEKSLAVLAKGRRLRVISIGGTSMCRDYSENRYVKELRRLLPNAKVDYGD